MHNKETESLCQLPNSTVFFVAKNAFFNLLTYVNSGRACAYGGLTIRKNEAGDAMLFEKYGVHAEIPLTFFQKLKSKKSFFAKCRRGVGYLEKAFVQICVAAYANAGLDSIVFRAADCWNACELPQKSTPPVLFYQLAGEFLAQLKFTDGADSFVLFNKVTRNRFGFTAQLNKEFAQKTFFNRVAEIPQSIFTLGTAAFKGALALHWQWRLRFKNREKQGKETDAFSVQNYLRDSGRALDDSAPKDARARDYKRRVDLQAEWQVLRQMAGLLIESPVLTGRLFLTQGILKFKAIAVDAKAALQVVQLRKEKRAEKRAQKRFISFWAFLFLKLLKEQQLRIEARKQRIFAKRRWDFNRFIGFNRLLYAEKTWSPERKPKVFVGRADFNEIGDFDYLILKKEEERGLPMAV